MSTFCHFMDFFLRIHFLTIGNDNQDVGLSYEVDQQRMS